LLDDPGLCRTGLLFDVAGDQIHAINNDGVFLAVYPSHFALLAAILACQYFDLISSSNTLCHIYSTSGASETIRM
jgi:hypothetical protein